LNSSIVDFSSSAKSLRGVIARGSAAGLSPARVGHTEKAGEKRQTKTPVNNKNKINGQK
jgi:hypothetical protein